MDLGDWLRKEGFPFQPAPGEPSYRVLEWVKPNGERIVYGQEQSQLDGEPNHGREATADDVDGENRLSKDGGSPPGG